MHYTSFNQTVSGKSVKPNLLQNVTKTKGNLSEARGGIQTRKSRNEDFLVTLGLPPVGLGNSLCLYPTFLQLSF